MQPPSKSYIWKLILSTSTTETNDWPFTSRLKDRGQPVRLLVEPLKRELNNNRSNPTFDLEDKETTWQLQTQIVPPANPSPSEHHWIQRQGYIQGNIHPQYSHPPWSTQPVILNLFTQRLEYQWVGSHHRYIRSPMLVSLTLLSPCTNNSTYTFSDRSSNVRQGFGSDLPCYSIWKATLSKWRD